MSLVELRQLKRRAMERTTEKKDNGEMDSYAMMIQYMTWSMSFGGGALSFY